MTIVTRRRLIASFLAWHLFAISVAALPPPNRLSHFPPRDPSSALSPFFYRITVAIDGMARGVEFVESIVWRVTRPMQPAINAYLRLTGLGQTWSMFANPPTHAQYMRVRYYVRSPEGRRWVATELVLPAHREDMVRAFQSFRDSYRDKAMAVTIARFQEHRKPAVIVPDARPEQLPTDLAPVARYFERAFVRNRLNGTGDRVVRTEVWVGTAPIAPLGQPIDDQAQFERAIALQAYYEGAIEQRLQVPPVPPYHAGEREADITWILEYFEEH